MLLSELAASVAEEWGKTGDYITTRRLERHIISARASTIQRRYDQSKRFPQSLVMTVQCPLLIEVEAAECPCLIPEGVAKRTLSKIPKPILLKDTTIFTFIGSGNFATPFGIVTPEEIQDIKHRRYSNVDIFACYMNEYIYILNQPRIDNIGFRYIPENPLEVNNYFICQSSSCIEDDDLVIEGSLEEGILGILERRRPLILQQNNEIDIND